MRFHKNLEADRVRKMPWKTQVGMIASELSRAFHLAERKDSEPAVMGCLQRARELLGVLESCAVPALAGKALRQAAESLAMGRLHEASREAEGLYHRLMHLYRSA